MSKLIASFTSFPARIGKIEPMVESIFAQTKQPDEFLLWLADSQFPGKENDLPEFINKYVDEGKLAVKWCKDLRPHKKYFYAMQENPEDVVVTLDDDLIYPENTLELLWESYKQHPNAVSAMRTHLINMDAQGRILPYSSWLKEIEVMQNEPSHLLLATSGAGTLFPPHILPKETFDEEAVFATCLNADDLWLKTMELAADVPVVAAAEWIPLNYVDGTQEDSLWSKNKQEEGGNDSHLAKIMAYLEEKTGENVWEKEAASLENSASWSGKLGEVANDAVAAMRGRYTGARRQHQQTNVKLQQTNVKLQQTYAEKRELNETLDNLRRKSAAQNGEIVCHLKNISNLKEERISLKEKVKNLKAQANKLEDKNKELSEKTMAQAKRIHDLENSTTYKVGKVIMWLPQKLKSLAKKLLKR